MQIVKIIQNCYESIKFDQQKKDNVLFLKTSRTQMNKKLSGLHNKMKNRSKPDK